jgi:hypothetical protein
VPVPQQRPRGDGEDPVRSERRRHPEEHPRRPIPGTQHQAGQGGLDQQLNNEDQRGDSGDHSTFSTLVSSPAQVTHTEPVACLAGGQLGEVPVNGGAGTPNSAAICTTVLTRRP